MMVRWKVAAIRLHPSVPSVWASAVKSATRTRVVISSAIAVYSSGARSKPSVLFANKCSDRLFITKRRTTATRSIQSRSFPQRHHQTTPLKETERVGQGLLGQRLRKCTTDWISLCPSHLASPTVQRSESNQAKANDCSSCFCISPAMFNALVVSSRTIRFHLDRMDPNGDVTFITDDCMLDPCLISMEG